LDFQSRIDFSFFVSLERGPGYPWPWLFRCFPLWLRAAFFAGKTFDVVLIHALADGVALIPAVRDAEATTATEMHLNVRETTVNISRIKFFVQNT
jgi:hypothetical protein